VSSVRVPEIIYDISNVAMGDKAEFLGLAKKNSPVVKMKIVGRMIQPYGIKLLAT